MTQTISIVEADFNRADHQDAVLTLLNASVSEPLLAEARSLTVHRLKDEPKVITLLAFADSQSTGIAICFRGFSTEADSPFLIISDFFVLPAHRGQGIARCLLENIERLARDLEVLRLTLRVHTQNMRALKVYAAAGFTAAPSGAPNDDAICMVRDIA